MTVNNNGTRYAGYRLWESRKNMPYDYTNDGLLRKIVSRKIWDTNNAVLRSLLGVYEFALIYCMKYADILCNYKNYLWRNR